MAIIKAEITAVGTKILAGQITNTNAQFLSEEFAKLRIDVSFQIAAGDNEECLLLTIDLASKRSELVVLCGGFGLTEDDLTKQTLAKHLGRDLVFDEQANKRLDEFLATCPQFARTANNGCQARPVEGSIPLQNSTGLAVGGTLEVNDVTYVAFPGPPSELKLMVLDSLVPLLPGDHKQPYSRVLCFLGIGGSQLVTVLTDLVDSQTDPTIAPYAKADEVTLRLSTKADDVASVKAKLDALEHKILAKKTLNSIPLEQLFYDYGDDNSMARVVLDLLKEKHKTVTAVESSTVGLFQSSIAGSSGPPAVLNGGSATYSIEEKSKMFHIPLEDSQEHGVVSRFTAEKMAEQSRLLTDVDFGIGLTGAAGPGSLEGYPAGTVFIGIATREKVHSICVAIGGRSRSGIRYIATLYAFSLVH